jgi:hypothetical protein
MKMKNIDYKGIERRSPERKPLKNQFTIELMRQINMPGNVVLINMPSNAPKKLSHKGSNTYNYED